MAIQDAGRLTPRNNLFGWLAAAAVVAGLITFMTPGRQATASMPPVKAVAAKARDFSLAGQRRLERGMDPAMLSLVSLVDRFPHADPWGRPLGWTSLDLDAPPTLGFSMLSADQAERLNSLFPASSNPTPAAPPFVLRTDGADRDRAVLCMTQAIYYEAAREPLEGQRAVAQTILNRVRHPNFPKTVCGVVYQGSQQITGCQFTFTCDGSRERAPMADYWERAKAVAIQALDGFVQKDVGTATFYHADYVFPRWGPTYVKIGQIGQHIFYRFPGPWGRAEALSGHYSGEELRVSMEGPPRAAIEAMRAAAAAGNVPIESFTIAAADGPPGALRQRVAGQVLFGRRLPTHDEIARINAQLPPLDAGAAPAEPPVITPPPPAIPKAGDLPVGAPAH